MADHDKSRPQQLPQQLPQRPRGPHPHAARLSMLAAAFVAAVLVLSGCGPKPGPAGTVVDKDRTYWSSTKQWTYKLTTRDKTGADHKFKVSHRDYKGCYRGSAYPKCTEVR